MAESQCDQAKGFWVRLNAGLFDLVLTAVVVWVVKQVALHLLIYLPFELTWLLVYLIYDVAAHAWKGRTVGKWLCGLALVRRDGRAAGVWRIVLRETLGKSLTAVSVGAGFAWSAFSRHKRALHDYVAGTAVVGRALPFGHWGRAAAALASFVALWVALDVPGLYELGLDALQMRDTAKPVSAYQERDPSQLIEANTLDDAQIAADGDWLRANAVDPIDYAVAKAQQHQVLVFGEAHERKEALAYFNAVIPELYRRAGVTRVAMEVCLAQDDAALARLVTAPTFDRDLALRLARHQPWDMWGFKGYWEVFETVWRLNQTIPADKPKVLIIGLDAPMDMQSLAMVGLEDNPAKYCAPWEKLRVIRLPRLMPKVMGRDVRMAAEIERQLLETHESAVVWVGESHAWASPQPMSTSGLCATRMGALLARRYGDRLWFVRLHDFPIAASLVDAKYHGPAPVIDEKMEAAVKSSGLTAAAFDTADSPFGLLRDSAVFDYYFEPRLGLEDIANGYLYLKPWRSYTHCDWLPGYISPRMFAAGKPAYQAFGKKIGKPVRTPDEANALFAAL